MSDLDGTWTALVTGTGTALMTECFRWDRDGFGGHGRL